MCKLNYLSITTGPNIFSLQVHLINSYNHHAIAIRMPWFTSLGIKGAPCQRVLDDDKGDNQVIGYTNGNTQMTMNWLFR